ncbi:HD-GYP domain-containing protein [Bradyrhizobium lablabi]|uniref:HD-GYP domain-containing protein n=1 Tax=Bradyrhizobium lablabi TaxID=722472 RepID=UPI00090C5EC2|nr:HD domain-containing phosphohydrolase [Bradyrhizobium lablabi]SHL93755.1 HDIG domain-containing protein [Bradyrhizobium lablabi]
MSVEVITDNSRKFADLRSMLVPEFVVNCAPLTGKAGVHQGCDAAVVAADLRSVENIAAIKELLSRLKHVRKRVFIIDHQERLFAAQAYALGATHVLVNPVGKKSLIATLADRGAPLAPTRQATGDARDVASGGAAAIASMFSSALTGGAIDVAAAKGAARRIADNIAEDGLSNWLDTVRRHHEGTYQHCLLVTGVAVDFGLSLGLAKADIERLHTAAMFHDIGKARIPLAVLDKPGRLDPQERALIETHPAAGYEVLKGTSGISPEVLDAVRHHHEYLDGSGYPDALCAASISDIVRMLTISDIFAALIEARSYKPGMPREQAYEIMRGMHGKLEIPLLSAFKEAALSR